MSSIELYFPNENRNEAKASSSLNPIAFKTCEGSTNAEEQSEPLETAMFSFYLSKYWNLDL
jgi:hypothetical protein